MPINNNIPPNTYGTFNSLAKLDNEKKELDEKIKDIESKASKAEKLILTLGVAPLFIAMVVLSVMDEKDIEKIEIDSPIIFYSRVFSLVYLLAMVAGLLYILRSNRQLTAINNQLIEINDKKHMIAFQTRPVLAEREPIAPIYPREEAESLLNYALGAASDGSLATLLQEQANPNPIAAVETDSPLAGRLRSRTTAGSVSNENLAGRSTTIEIGSGTLGRSRIVKASSTKSGTTANFAGSMDFSTVTE